MKLTTSLATFLTVAGLLFATSTISAEQGAKPAGGQETYTLYQYKASSKALKMLDKQLQSDPRFKEQGCEAIGKRTPRYVCKKNDATTQSLFATGVAADVDLNSSMAACPTGCVYMRCPPPIGPWKCCNFSNYQPC